MIRRDDSYVTDVRGRSMSAGGPPMSRAEALAYARQLADEHDETMIVHTQTYAVSGPAPTVILSRAEIERRRGRGVWGDAGDIER